MNNSKKINFRKFITQSDFTKNEQKQILRSIQDPRNAKILKLTIILFSWNTCNFFIESVLLGGGFIFSSIEGFDIVYFLPEIIFVVLNFFAKIFFIQFFMKGYAHIYQTIIASIPSAGPFIIMGKLLYTNRLLMKGVRKYINYKRKRFIQNLFSQYISK